MGNGAHIGKGPVANIGIETFDGAGHSSAVETYSGNGQAGHDTFKTTYTVKANCTGIRTLTWEDGSVSHLDLVVVDGGHEVYWIVTDSSFTTSGIKKKI